MTFERKVLVAGGGGFIGINFLKHFVKKYPDYYFLCVDKLNYASNYDNITGLNKFPNFKFIHMDIGDDSLIEVVKQYEISEIVNFAAESCVDKSFDDPLFFTKNNVLSTQNLLEVYRELYDQIKYMIHISTDEVYGDKEGVKDESSVLNPTNPYSATKAAIDLIINSYIYSFNMPITIIRPNNVYGPLQYPEKIIPLIIDKIKQNKPTPIHGNGRNKRRYLYIMDLLNAIDIVWHTKRQVTTGQIYNVGNDDEPIDNNSLVKLINTIFDGNSQIEYVKDRNYNDIDYSISSSKIKQLGWRSEYSLKDGLSLYKTLYK